MPKCKNCHKNITKFDKERCPYCGCLNPLEGHNYETSDITQTIDILSNKEEVKFVQHKKLTNNILMMFLGIFGADLFYLGFYKSALIRLAINIVVYGILFETFYFTNIFSIYSLLLSLIIPFGILFVVYFILGIISFSIKSKKDSNGVFLK